MPTRKPLPEPAHAIPLSQEELELVGRFIVAWNMLEGHLDAILLVVSGLSIRAVEAIMSSPHIPARMDTFIAILETQPGWVSEYRTEAVAMAKKIMDLSNFRNEIAHGRWAEYLAWDEADGTQTSPTFKVMAQKQIRAKTAVTVMQLRQRYEEVCRLTRQAADTFSRMRHTSQIWPHPPPPSPWHGTF